MTTETAAWTTTDTHVRDTGAESGSGMTTRHTTLRAGMAWPGSGRVFDDNGLARTCATWARRCGRHRLTASPAHKPAHPGRRRCRLLGARACGAHCASLSARRPTSSGERITQSSNATGVPSPHVVNATVRAQARARDGRAKDPDAPRLHQPARQPPLPCCSSACSAAGVDGRRQWFRATHTTPSRSRNRKSVHRLISAEQPGLLFLQRG
jgi:hypothetical protein